MALITAAQFKEHYPQMAGTASDTRIDTIIARADALMAAYCGYPPYSGGGGARSMTSQSYVTYHDGPSATEPDVLCLCVRPVTAIGSIYVDTTRVYGASSAFVSGVDFERDDLLGILVLLPAAARTWSAGFRSIKASFTGGFVTTPPDLVALAAMTTRHLWDLREVQGETAYGIGGDTATRTDFDAAIPASVRAMLDKAYLVCTA